MQLLNLLLIIILSAIFILCVLKYEVLDEFLTYKVEVNNPCNTMSKYLRSDIGGEYQFFFLFCENISINV